MKTKISDYFFRFWILALMLQVLFQSCSGVKETPNEYPRMIGDIAFDANLDNPNFELCNNENIAVQYYALSGVVVGKPYLNEKYEVEKIFEEKYNSEIVKKQSGLIRLRFLVNCKGEADRYRFIGMDKNYNETMFDDSITNQLLSITKNFVKWKAFTHIELPRDYYMYLIFKLEDGQIVEIMP